MKKYLILGFALLMLSARLPAQNRVTATLSAAAANCATTNVCLVLPITPQVGGVTLTSSANASGNTLQFEATANGGTTWVALNATPSNSTTAATSTTSTGTWQANVAGYTAIRIRMSNLVSGTSTVTISTSTASARAGGGGGGGGGSVVSCTTTGGVAFENGTNNTLTCGAPLVWLPGSANPGGLVSDNTATITGASPAVLGGAGESEPTINSPNTSATDHIGWSGGIFGHGSGIFSGSLIALSATANYDGTGTVQELDGNFIESNSNSGGGTVHNSYGFNAGDQHGVGDTLNAAFFAPDQGTGANDYAMYLAGGKAHSVGPIDSNGSISANSDGVHAGEVALLGQTTAPTIPANSFGFIGPNSASFTSWFIQPTATAPAAQCMVSLGITASNISALTCPTLTPVANGGTALATLTAHALYVGNAASAPNAVSVGATGTVLAGSTGADPAFTATPAVTSIATGTSPPTCTVGTAGALCENEGTAPTGAASVDMVYADSTGHCLDAINNNTNNGCLVTNAAALTSNVLTKGGGAQAVQTSSITDDAKNITTSEVLVAGNKVFVTADFTDSTTNTLTAITGLTWTLPTSKAVNVSFHCGLLFDQATAAVSDSFGIGVTGTAPTQANASGTVFTSASVEATGTLVALASTTPTAVVTFTPSAITTVWKAELDGTIEQPSNATPGVFNIYVSTSTGADNIIVKRGSYCSLF